MHADLLSALEKYGAGPRKSREQIIDNIEKDNEVKQQREARKSSAINRIAGLQFRGKRESEREFTQEKREGYKSGRGMPRLPEARKDVASCEKARGSASGNRSGHIRMGQPGRLKAGHQARAWGERRELKHLSTCRRRKKTSIPGVVAIETGRAQTGCVKARPGL